MNLSIDDRGEADIDSHNSPPSGSEGTFTNSTLRIDSWTSPFDWAATVSDWFSRTSSAFNVNFTAIDNGLQEDDYSHDLSTQQVNRTVDLNNPRSRTTRRSKTSTRISRRCSTTESCSLRSRSEKTSSQRIVRSLRKA